MWSAVSCPHWSDRLSLNRGENVGPFVHPCTGRFKDSQILIEVCWRANCNDRVLFFCVCLTNCVVLKHTSVSLIVLQKCAGSRTVWLHSHGQILWTLGGNDSWQDCIFCPTEQGGRGFRIQPQAGFEDRGNCCFLLSLHLRNHLVKWAVFLKGFNIHQPCWWQTASQETQDT